MDNLEIIDLVHERLDEKNKEHNVRHLNEIIFDGEPALSLFGRIYNQFEPVVASMPFLWDDVFFISNDLVTFTGWLYLLRPSINDATKEHGTYFQNRYDARYLGYAANLASAVYNFWDRTGDLLNGYFQTGLHDSSVYVGRVLNNFPNEHKDSEHYLRLKDIHDDEVKVVLDERNEDVHDRSFPARHFVDTLVKRDSQREAVAFKLGLPDLFKEQTELAYEGLGSALRLIEERGARKPR
jgi:hypothetical protein